MVNCDDAFLWNIIESKLNDSGVPAGRIRAVYHAFLKEARKIMHQGGNQLSIGGIIDKDKYQAWGVDPQILNYIENILKYCK